ncbi:hypothetical protein GCM10027299_21550 [Larkinella ripae]
MAARTQELVAGDEIYLYVKVASAYIQWGCMDSFTYRSSIEAFEVNCRAFAGKVPSGKLPSWSISSGGFYRIFDNTNEATNISVSEAHNYHTTKSVLEIKFGTDKANDPIWTGKAFISEFELNGNQGEAAKYSITLEGAEPISVSANPS